MTDVNFLQLHYNTWNHLTVCKQMSPGLFKNLIYLIYMYKEDLALNNLQSRKTLPNQAKAQMWFLFHFLLSL